jgi:AcrR family transcriptional regulator
MVGSGSASSAKAASHEVLRGVAHAGIDVTHRLGPVRVVEIQRARILAAMAEVSAERGAGNVTVADVVERAGVSRRTFYELFEDREACFLAAFDDAVARAARHLLAVYDDEADWVVRIRTSLAVVLSFLDAERGAAQLLIVGSLGAGAEALERRWRVLKRLITLVDEARTEAKVAAGLPALTAEGVVGGVLSVLHSRLLAPDDSSLLELAGPLMGMIVLPYLGPAAARKELARPIPRMLSGTHSAEGNPLGELEMRLTYRTVRVLIAIAAHPGSSNRIVADTAEVTDQGQMSKLLARLQQIGLIENTGGGASRGEPNCWMLTDKGRQLQGAIARQTTRLTSPNRA